ncbi:hypothetical protein DKT68_15265 [Micromonospora acroterricola]|uniref:Uncharacterized protein n=1 Tax=Micromonospora acroterricola TaxID=2202421 RepID=A0A317D251_9ACTN|nr:hypothetical protein [Micromonospora acroterricola]PWR08574.1 hypothetical protein DKT68_15265 [Micromonospora acroterricola]
MPDLVRIRDKNTNAEYSVGRRRAEQLAERGAEVVKDGDATDRMGRALPASETAKSTKTTAGKEQTR